MCTLTALPQLLCQLKEIPVTILINLVIYEIREKMTIFFNMLSSKSQHITNKSFAFY
jgi:hypothetical protein